MSCTVSSEEGRLFFLLTLSRLCGHHGGILEEQAATMQRLDVHARAFYHVQRQVQINLVEKRIETRN